MHRYRNAFGLGLAVIALGTRADAGTVTFTDIEAFLAAAGNVQLIDFNTLPDGRPSFHRAEITPDFNYTDQGVTFSPRAGTLFLRTAGGFDLVAGIGSEPPNMIIADLVVPASAVGVILPASTILQALDTDGNLIEMVAGGGSDLGFFVGIISDVPIAQVIGDGDTSLQAFQELYFTPIPEPATVFLVVLGAAGILMKRRV